MVIIDIYRKNILSEARNGAALKDTVEQRCKGKQLYENRKFNISEERL